MAIIKRFHKKNGKKKITFYQAQVLCQRYECLLIKVLILQEESAVIWHEIQRKKIKKRPFRAFET